MRTDGKVERSKMWKTLVIVTMVWALTALFQVPIVRVLPPAMMFSFTSLLLIEWWWYRTVNCRDYVHIAAALSLAYFTLAPSFEGLVLTSTLFYITS